MNQQDQILKDYLLARKSPKDFINNFCKIQNPSEAGISATTGQFKLWDFQEDLLDWWLKERLTIILKARQLGISWLVMAFSLWLANFHEDVVILCMSQNEKKAWGLIDKVKFMYDRLPGHLKKPLIVRNRGELVFADDQGNEGSRIIALPSTPANAISYTATLVVNDEWAEQEYAEDTWGALEPTVNAGGRVIGLSTGSSIGSFFHGMWNDAERHESGFEARFLPFNFRPNRDADWYEKTKKNYLYSLQEFYRQYPRNPVEAFLAAGGCPFNIEALEFYESEVVEEAQTQEKLAGRIYEGLYKYLSRDELKIWETPRNAGGYLIAVDPATGQEGKDYHGVHVLKLGRIEQVCEFQSRCSLDELAYLITQLGHWYGEAELVIERNNTGYAILNLLQNHIFYGNIYAHEDTIGIRVTRRSRPSLNKTEKLGWPSTRPNNAVRDATLIEAINGMSVVIRSSRCIDEMKGYVRQADGTYSSTGKAHDDLCTSLGMGLLVASQRGASSERRGIRARTTKVPTYKKERWM